MKNNSAFSLVEVLLALSIIGGAVLCLIGLFPSSFAKIDRIEQSQALHAAERKIDALIQSRPFPEVFLATQERKSLKISPNSHATLAPSPLKDISGITFNDYESSYFAIDVAIALNNSPTTSTFTTVKNR